MSEELVEQPVPEDSRCPECGGEPSEVSHTLSDLGYLHDDQRMVCEDCENQWVCGVPIGETSLDSRADDLQCGSCEEWFLVHRIVQTRGENLTLHLKCPQCNNWEYLTRIPDDKGRILMGYPQITGETEGCDPYGYDPDEHDPTGE